jgi:LysM repeat protein
MWKCLPRRCSGGHRIRPEFAPGRNRHPGRCSRSPNASELTLRLEQLERENAELRQRSHAADKSYATVAQLNDAVADVARNIRTAVAAAKTDTLQHVSSQLEKLGKQTSAALDSLAKIQATRPVVQTDFRDDFGEASHTVQKGDSLAGIAKKTGAKQQDIVNANKISDPSRIVVGQTLFIPGGK